MATHDLLIAGKVWSGINTLTMTDTDGNSIQYTSDKPKYSGAVTIRTPTLQGLWIIDTSKLINLLTSGAQSGTIEQLVTYQVGVKDELDSNVQQKYYYMAFNFDAQEFTYRIDDIEAVYRVALNGWDNDHAFNHISESRGVAQGQIISFESEQSVSTDFYLLFIRIATLQTKVNGTYLFKSPVTIPDGTFIHQRISGSMDGYVFDELEIVSEKYFYDSGDYVMYYRFNVFKAGEEIASYQNRDNSKIFEGGYIEFEKVEQPVSLSFYEWLMNNTAEYHAGDELGTWVLSDKYDVNTTFIYPQLGTISMSFTDAEGNSYTGIRIFEEANDSGDSVVKYCSEDGCFSVAGYMDDFIFYSYYPEAIKTITITTIPDTIKVYSFLSFAGEKVTGEEEE